MIDLNNLPKNIDKQIFNATIRNYTPYTIGQTALGGKIAYILQPGDPGYVDGFVKGFVATLANQSTGSAWGCNGTLITGADGIELGTGEQNTIDILAGCADAGTAAKICGDLIQGGYNDWYLPSKDELNKLFLNRAAIGGFVTFTYWSSTELDANNAYTQSFNSGAQGTLVKTYAGSVRAIRSFSEEIPSEPWNTWQTWTKPNGASTAYIVCIGGGAGGGGGCTSATSGVNKGGGAGGGASAITIAQVSFYSIPDTLYIKVGLGGLKGLASLSATSGDAGGISYVSFYPSNDMSSCLLINGGAPSGGGGGSTASGGSAGGGGGALSSSSTTNPRYLSLCNWASYGGGAGLFGGFSGTVDTTMCSSSIVTQGVGASGVGSTNNSVIGRAVNAGDGLASFQKTRSAGAINGGNGVNGYEQLKPFMFVSGSSGGSSYSGAAGQSGTSAIGCGGAGGAAGATGANGANGGNGLVMIISY